MQAPWGAVATVSPLQTGGQVPLGPAKMLADLTSTSAPCLSELGFHCWAETTDNLPYRREGQWRGQYAQMIPPPLQRASGLSFRILMTQRSVYGPDFLDVSSAPQTMRFSLVLVMTDGRGNRRQHSRQ